LARHAYKQLLLFGCLSVCCVFFGVRAQFLAPLVAIIGIVICFFVFVVLPSRASQKKNEELQAVGSKKTKSCNTTVQPSVVARQRVGAASLPGVAGEGGQRGRNRNVMPALSTK
jgi:hypothetical protein